MAIHRTDLDKNFAVFTVVDEVTAEELMATLETFYSESPTRDILWDIRQGTITQLFFDNIRIIAANVTELAKGTHRGKTAILISDNADYGVGRMFSAFAEIREVPFTVRVFRDYDEAMAWLRDPPKV